jgi:hypothetical protein
MRRSLRFIVLAFLAVFWAVPAPATMRCGRDLVDRGDTTAELLLACGEPQFQQVVGIRKTATAELVVEQWVYNFGPGTLLQIVTVEGGVIAEFDDGSRQ